MGSLGGLDVVRIQDVVDQRHHLALALVFGVIAVHQIYDLLLDGDGVVDVIGHLFLALDFEEL